MKLTKEEIEKRLLELKDKYEDELKNGTGDFATDHAKNLHGEIRAIEWVIKFWETGYYEKQI